MTNDAEKAEIGRVIDALYSSISGPAGPRDWETASACFHEEGRQIRTGIHADGTPWIKIMTPVEYRLDTQPFFERTAFYELELKRRIEIFGNIAHVWSLYEARLDLHDVEPERRGINSIQLYKDESGTWKVISMIWDNERPGVVHEPF